MDAVAAIRKRSRYSGKVHIVGIWKARVNTQNSRILAWFYAAARQAT
jgi:hypothetical protein